MTIFAVLVAGAVVMGMLALTIDVGNIMYERRQVQNGADAAVLALAQDCAVGASGCDSSALPALETLAGLNDNDGETDVTGICAKAGTSISLPECPAPQTDYGRLKECLPLPAGAASLPYVEARTQTLQNGDTILPKFFSGLLVNGGAGDTTVEACARATWGPMGSSGLTMPLVLGLCNWNEATANGTSFAPSPPYSPAPKTSSDVPGALQPSIYPIFGHLNPSDDQEAMKSKFGCWPDLNDSPPPGLYTPGGFGWVKTCAEMGSAAPPECVGADPCTAVFNATGNVNASPGGSVATGCSGNLDEYVGTEVEIPVITAVAGTGNNAVYTVEGIASYFLAGYSEMPSGDPKTYNGYDDDADAYKAETCFNYKSSCIWGWFTAPLRPVGSLAPGGGTPRGPIVVAPAG